MPRYESHFSNCFQIALVSEVSQIGTARMFLFPALANWIMYFAMGMIGQLGMCFHEGLVNREMFFKRGYVTWIKYAFLKVKPFILGAESSLQ